MCAYSFIADQWNNPGSPNYVPWTPQSPSPELAKMMLDVLQRLDVIDKKLAAKDCKLERKAKAKLTRKLKKRAAVHRSAAQQGD